MSHFFNEKHKAFRPPSYLTSRGAGIENSVKKSLSARASASALCLCLYPKETTLYDDHCL